MQNSQALAIIRSLANGLDPATGRELPPSSPFEQPSVIRALFAAARALEASAEPPAQAPASTCTPPQSQPSLATPARADLVAPTAQEPQAPAPNPEPAGWAVRPGNAGKPWSRDEDARLSQGFDRGVSMEVLAQIHQRTQQSIHSRLVRLGKIEAPDTPPST